MSDVVESIDGMCHNYEDAKALMFALDAIKVDADFTEDVAKHFVGSWLQCYDFNEDEEYKKEVVKWLKNCIDYVEGD